MPQTNKAKPHKHRFNAMSDKDRMLFIRRCRLCGRTEYLNQNRDFEVLVICSRGDLW